MSTLDHVSSQSTSLEEVTEQARGAVETSRAELHQAMRQARQAGHTLQQIADAAGVTRQRVWQIVNEND